MAAKKTVQRKGFKTSEHIVYPSHGVGQIMELSRQEIAGFELEMFVIFFAKDKLTLKVPIDKIDTVGMRKLSDRKTVAKALKTVQGRARIKRVMWSRRAQEYEAKINSGDLIQIAEVVRDLFRSEHQPEQSYSERQLYEAALEQISRELSMTQKITFTEAVNLVEENLAKGPSRAPKAQEEREGLEEGSEKSQTAAKGQDGAKSRDGKAAKADKADKTDKTDKTDKAGKTKKAGKAGQSDQKGAKERIIARKQKQKPKPQEKRAKQKAPEKRKKQKAASSARSAAA